MYCKLCADIDSKINTLIMNVQFFTVYAQTIILALTHVTMTRLMTYRCEPTKFSDRRLRGAKNGPNKATATRNCDEDRVTAVRGAIEDYCAP